MRPGPGGGPVTPVTDLWDLPRTLPVGDREVPIRADFRDVLRVLDCLADPALPEFLRWQVALKLFYQVPVPKDRQAQAAGQLAEFISGGQELPPGPRLLDWGQDAALIISDVNRVAGRELRQEDFVHWWTFLGWFHAIGPGQLSAVVAIRDKLRRGRPLDPQEQEFYRRNKSRVELKRRCTPQEAEEKQRLMEMLEGR